MNLYQLKREHAAWLQKDCSSGQRQDSETILALIEQLTKHKALLDRALDELDWYGGDEAWGAGEPVWRRPPIYRDSGNRAREAAAAIRKELEGLG